MPEDSIIIGGGPVSWPPPGANQQGVDIYPKVETPKPTTVVNRRQMQQPRPKPVWESLIQVFGRLSD